MTLIVATDLMSSISMVSETAFSSWFLSEKTKSGFFSNLFLTTFSKSLFPIHILYLFKSSTNLFMLNTVSLFGRTSLGTTNNLPFPWNMGSPNH